MPENKGLKFSNKGSEIFGIALEEKPTFEKNPTFENQIFEIWWAAAKPKAQQLLATFLCFRKVAITSDIKC